MPRIVRLAFLLPAFSILPPAGSGAFAQDLTDPVEILRRSASALKAAMTVRYDAVFMGTGWIKQHVPHISGKAFVGPTAEYDVPRFLSELEIRDNDSEEVSRFTIGCNGDEYFLIDPKTKSVHRDMDPIVMGTNSRNLQRLVVKEFSAKEPLKDELGAKETTLDGSTTIGGEPCYEVRVTLEDGSPKAVVWSISKKDYLPRRVIRIYAGRPEGADDGTTDITMTNLVASPNFAEGQFALSLPAGFTETDDIAP